MVIVMLLLVKLTMLSAGFAYTTHKRVYSPTCIRGGPERVSNVITYNYTRPKQLPSTCVRYAFRRSLYLSTSPLVVNPAIAVKGLGTAVTILLRDGITRGETHKITGFPVWYMTRYRDR